MPTIVIVMSVLTALNALIMYYHKITGEKTSGVSRGWTLLLVWSLPFMKGLSEVTSIGVALTWFQAFMPLMSGVALILAVWILANIAKVFLK